MAKKLKDFNYDVNDYFDYLMIEPNKKYDEGLERINRDARIREKTLNKVRANLGIDILV